MSKSNSSTPDRDQLRIDLLSEEAMQIVSGRPDRPAIHFEAPPSREVRAEMDQFTTWFKRTAPDGHEPLRALIQVGLSTRISRASTPIKEGNGRLGRVLAGNFWHRTSVSRCAI